MVGLSSRDSQGPPLSLISEPSLADYYRKLAKRRQRVSGEWLELRTVRTHCFSDMQVFLNPYDRGYRENLRDFFNVGPGRR